jgi:hypothetical protein
VTRRQMEQKIEELTEDIRKLKAGSQSGHCHGCHCSHVIYYPWATTGTSTVTPWTSTYVNTGSGGYYQLPGGGQQQ